jgi:hypothetical protein
MNFVMYFHHKLFPDPTQRPSYWKCSCGKTIFKANAQNIIVANDIGLPWDEYPPSQHLIEVMCHHCGNTYKILFQ